MNCSNHGRSIMIQNNIFYSVASVFLIFLFLFPSPLSPTLSILKTDWEKGLDIFSRILIKPAFESEKLTLARGLKIEERDDLIRFQNLYHHPENVMTSVSGDIDSKEAETLMKRYFGIWQPTGEKVKTPSLLQPQQGEIFILPKDAPQSILILACLVPANNDQQYYPLEIIDFIVGSGGSRTRIFQEIKTNRGLPIIA
jgi:predicted Zn-dependent peptidase